MAPIPVTQNQTHTRMNALWMLAVIALLTGLLWMDGSPARPATVLALDAIIPCGDVVTNGGFEAGGTGWSGNFQALQIPVAAHSGNGLASMSGSGGSLSQALNTSELRAGDTLSISYWHAGGAATASLHTTVTNSGPFSGYNQVSISYTLTADAQPVTLTIAQADGTPSFDDVTASCTGEPRPLTILIELDKTTAAPGDTVTVTVDLVDPNPPIPGEHGVLSGTIPTGTTLVPGSGTWLLCSPCEALNVSNAVAGYLSGFWQAPVGAAPGTLARVQYAVTIDPDAAIGPISFLSTSKVTSTAGGGAIIGLSVSLTIVAPSATPSPTATSTPTETATSTATEALPTATDTATSTVTVAPPTATDTATSTVTVAPPTATDTATSTVTVAPPTATDTATSTVTVAPPTATDTATSTVTQDAPTATEATAPATTTSSPTDVPANTPTAVPPTTESTGTIPVQGPGTLVVTIVTNDGSPIPDDTEVCVGDVCQSLDEIAAASAPSGTSATFAGLAAGSHQLTILVDGALVYEQTVTVTADQTIEITVVLPTAGPGTPSVVPVTPGGNSGPPPVTSLPSTGTGSDASWAAYLVLLGGAALVSLAGGLTWRQRRRS